MTEVRYFIAVQQVQLPELTGIAALINQRGDETRVKL
jgi:hypothetical protein